MSRRAGRSISIKLAVAVAAILWMVGARAEEHSPQPLKISNGDFSVELAPDQSRGYAVVLGDPEARFARALARETDLTICLQVASPRVGPLRAALAKDGLLNRRIHVDAGNADPIPLADNVALTVAGETRRARLSSVRVQGSAIEGPVV